MAPASTTEQGFEQPCSPLSLALLKTIVSYASQAEQELYDSLLRIRSTDHEKMLLACTHFMFRRFSAMSATTLPQIEKTHRFAPILRTSSWDTVEEETYRYLARIVDHLSDFGRDYKKILRKMELSGDASACKPEHFSRACKMGVELRATLRAPSSWETLACASGVRQTLLRCGDHYHTTDGLHWPHGEEAVESSLEPGQAPQIAFRSFRYKLLLQDKKHLTSYVSAV